MSMKNKNKILTIIVGAIIVALIYRNLPALLNFKDNGAKDYISFYKQQFKGKITAVDAGRGIKIKLDNYGSYILLPGYSCIDCKEQFTFDTGRNIGDSLIKNSQSDTFLIKQLDNKIMKFKIVR